MSGRLLCLFQAVGWEEKGGAFVSLVETSQSGPCLPGSLTKHFLLTLGPESLWPLVVNGNDFAPVAFYDCNRTP